jgi:hypothetical protein
MELSTLAIRVLLLFFPGVICALLVDALTVHRERTPAQFLTHSFVLGLGSYLSLNFVRDIVFQIAHSAGWRRPLPVTFFDALIDEKLRISWGEIALATLAAVVLGIGVSAALNHQFIHTAANRLRITKKFGDLDVWALLFNSPEVGWVVVRDLANDLTFRGWVDAYSDHGATPELLLRNVTVFRSSTGDQLYGTERVYLARPGHSLLIEPAADENTADAR